MPCLLAIILAGVGAAAADVEADARRLLQEFALRSFYKVQCLPRSEFFLLRAVCARHAAERQVSAAGDAAAEGQSALRAVRFVRTVGGATAVERASAALNLE